MINNDIWDEPTIGQRIQKLHGLCDDLEVLQTVIDDIDSTDADGNRILHYLRTETTTIDVLSNKRRFIVNMIEDALEELKEELY